MFSSIFKMIKKEENVIKTEFLMAYCNRIVLNAKNDFNSLVYNDFNSFVIGFLKNKKITDKERETKFIDSYYDIKHWFTDYFFNNIFMQNTASLHLAQLYVSTVIKANGLAFNFFNFYPEFKKPLPYDDNLTSFTGGRI